MSNFLGFGQFKGKSHEWVFFRAPWYARWLYNNGIYRQRHSFDEVEATHFPMLYRRASHLKGTCEQCNQPATRMGLTFLASGSLSSVGFFCNNCKYLGGARTTYETPSFFPENARLPRNAQRMITDEIRRRYIHGRLTQKKMEGFFTECAF
jgi:hypothetical protein